MTSLHQIDRRLFLRELGRGTIAVAVLGPAVIACSDSSDSSGANTTAAPPSTSGRASTTSTEQPTTTEPRTTASADDESTTTSEQPTTTTSEATAAFRWERVSLGSVSAYVLARGREIAIVDTGGVGSTDQIATALTALGATYDDVDHVIVTHLHGDHAGGLRGVLAEAADATAYAGEADVAGIATSRPLTALNDGDEVFGLQIIGTPGHTAGHISVLDEATGFLVAGDALVESNGMIMGPIERFSDDIALANDSVRKLATRDFDTAVFGHGDPFVGAASEAVVALAATL